MTVITVGMLALHHRITLKDRLVIQASFNQEGPGGMVRLVRRVLLITFVAEFAGMILLTAAFLVSTDMRLWEALWQGFFHSVSAFCNAGFDNIGREPDPVCRESADQFHRYGTDCRGRHRLPRLQRSCTGLSATTRGTRCGGG